MNCDRIAPFYEVFERVAFGRRLERHRVAFLCAAEGKSKALIVGDGDGRFTRTLARSYPALEIDSVELSAGMVAVARHRLNSMPRVNISQGDALEYRLPQSTYDVVFTHFFLDCFNNSQVAILAKRLSDSLNSQGIWIVSEFRQSRYGWRKLFTYTSLSIMYCFFRYATGLQTRRLPDHTGALQNAGFAKHQERVSMAGLVASEWWER